MSSGAPTWKYLSPSASAPKMSAMSSSVASPASLKWVGTVLTGSNSPAPLTRISSGLRVTVPNVDVPDSTCRRNVSLALGGFARMPGETQSRVTSVIMVKNSCCAPSTTTNLPARMFSTDRSPVSFIWIPVCRLPRTTVPIAVRSTRGAWTDGAAARCSVFAPLPCLPKPFVPFPDAIN